MKDEERKIFEAKMHQISMAYNSPLNDEQLDVAWNALKDWTTKDVLWSIDMHVKDVDQGMFMPRPAHLMKHLQGRQPENATYNPVTGKWITHDRSNKALGFHNYDPAGMPDEAKELLMKMKPNAGPKRSQSKPEPSGWQSDPKRHAEIAKLLGKA